MAAMKNNPTIQIELSRADLKAYVDSLADGILNDTHIEDQFAPAVKVPRLWRGFRRFYVARNVRASKRYKQPYSVAELERMQAIHDHEADLIDRLCPLLG
jgi:hypothetical protein